MEKNFGQDGQHILPNFRQFTRSYIDQFLAERDRVYKLLGPKQQYSSGIFREGLLKDFLRTSLPKSISINSGFVYGFEVEECSKQIDIIIWDSNNYGPIFSTNEYVIVNPESVIAVVTVKSNMEKYDIEDGIQNLNSIISLDKLFRISRINLDGTKIFNPIHKYFISFSGPKNPSKAGETISKCFCDLILSNQNYTNDIILAMKQIDPMNPDNEAKNAVTSIIPRMFLALESGDGSFYTGWGSPSDKLGNKEYGPEKLKRLPYLYKQNNDITTQLDKFMADLLGIVNKYLKIPGWSTSAAWDDMHPVYGFRMGDTSEINEEMSWPLIDPEKMQYIENKKSEFHFPDE